MEGKRLRTSLFGFNKSDVCDYIRSMDERVDEKIKDKEKEINELRAQLDEMHNQREEIVNVLHNAEKNAKTIIEDAQKNADELKMKTDVEIEEQKDRVNREIEIKRRAIKSYYAAENRKIAQIKDEVEKMRLASVEAIKRFESELSEIEKLTDNKSGYISSAIDFNEKNRIAEPFSDVVRAIHVHNVSRTDEE